MRNFRIVIYANVDTRMSEDLLKKVVLACEARGARVISLTSDMASGKNFMRPSISPILDNLQGQHT